MGNCASKTLREVEAVDRKHAGLQESIASAKAEVVALRDEKARLQTRAQELEGQFFALEQEHQEQSKNLQEDLRNRDNELHEQRQATNAAVADYERAKETTLKLEEQVKTLEAQRDALVQDSVLERRQAQTVAANSQEKMQDMLIELAQMREEVRKLTASNQESVKVIRALTSERQVAIEELGRLEAEAAIELESTGLEYEQKMEDLSKELASTKAALAQAQVIIKQQPTQAKQEAPPTNNTIPKRHYWEPFRFSTGKDLRIELCDFRGETRVDIREWYSDVRSKKGVNIPVKDAQKLAKILPEVVRQAKLEEV